MYSEIVKGLLLPFFTALGVIIGGSFIGGLAALFYPESPFYRMQTLAGDVKLWAIVVVIGGTFPTLRALDSGLFGGEAIHLVRQMARHYGGLPRLAGRLLDRHDGDRRAHRLIRFSAWTRRAARRRRGGAVARAYHSAPWERRCCTAAALKRFPWKTSGSSDRLSDLEERYERLLQQPASRLQAKDVVVELIDFSGDERTELHLRRFVRDLVQEHVIGQPVTDIDHLLMQKLVHDRHVTFENREWRLTRRYELHHVGDVLPVRAGRAGRR